MSQVPADYKRKYRVPAVFMLLLRDQKFFMLRRKNTGWMDGMFTLPSGHVEAGETYLEAAIRETKEEAGVTLKPENVRFIHLCERDEEENTRIWDDVYFVCADFEGQPYAAEPHKASEGVRFDYKNPSSEQIIPAVTHVLAEVKKGSFYSAYPAD